MNINTQQIAESISRALNDAQAFTMPALTAVQLGEVLGYINKIQC
ncbi:hypothetical protein [Photobacterium indicum]|nr:hypothetical protein [Photobacterium indicum]